MKLFAYAIAILVGFLGTMFLIGSQGQVIRLVVGIVLIMGAIAIVYLSRIQPKISETTTIQKIDLSGDINLEEIRCQSCNAPLNKDDIDRNFPTSG